jgi:hypothetical protein
MVVGAEEPGVQVVLQVLLVAVMAVQELQVQ